jgi:hypothetical protein
MSLTRWATKRDGNEGDVMRALGQVGARYIILDAFDLLVLFRGRVAKLLSTQTATHTQEPSTIWHASPPDGWHHLDTDEARATCGYCSPAVRVEE